ncbi:hypothetical protein [Micromonospora cathayae]|uniref:Uncharacterized protein n=1 Tax=Micromonospora cathayae TaxID=3028804 RepID=A0ABY7ZME3_9ACTN|nr:hypothetical protein [Micromonospora sp. HUAS 3]WDZ84028.1 hypothetical protein PVK37_26730 [Micromonospora sp. HUAS 3]
MPDPESVSLTQLREVFAELSIVIDEDFVRLDWTEDTLTIYRLVRSPAGLPMGLPDGGVQVTGTRIQVVAALPSVGPAPTDPPPEQLADG